MTDTLTARPAKSGKRGAAVDSKGLTPNEHAAAVDGLMADLEALANGQLIESTTTVTTKSPIKAEATMSTPVDFDTPFKRYQGQPMAKHA